MNAFELRPWKSGDRKSDTPNKMRMWPIDVEYLSVMHSDRRANSTETSHIHSVQHQLGGSRHYTLTNNWLHFQYKYIKNKY